MRALQQEFPETAVCLPFLWPRLPINPLRHEKAPADVEKPGFIFFMQVEKFPCHVGAPRPVEAVRRLEGNTLRRTL